jgi:KDO2-lipid IV(A) lauroyltransferase
MAKSRSRALDYLVYLAVRIVVCVVQALPVSAAWQFAEYLAWLVYHVDRRHRSVASENLRLAFPDLDAAAVNRLVRQVYRHSCLMLIEMILIPRKLHRSNVERHIRYPSPSDRLVGIQWFKSQRPLLAVTGHLGNWELLSYSFGMYGFRGGIIARRLDNPYLDRFLERFRSATGQAVLDKNEDYEKIRQTLAAGQHLGVVGDQDAGPRGVFVEFFGRPASTHKSIALLSLEYSAPIVVLAALRRKEPLHYDVHLADIILPEDYAHRAEAVRLITERHTKALEKLARIDPSQYFWPHRRWKSQPPVRKSLPKGPLKNAA